LLDSYLPRFHEISMCLEEQNLKFATNLSFWI